MSVMSDRTVDSSSGGDTSPAGWWHANARRVWSVVKIAVVLVVVAFVVWWLMLSPVKVTTHQVTAGTVSAEVLGTGTLEARVTATVGPKMTGLITRVAVDQGDRVKGDDTLIELEDTDYKQQVGVAEEDVAVAVAAIERLDAEKRKAQAVLSLARLTHQRQEQAAAANASSQQELDRTAEALAIAEAELTRTQAAIGAWLDRCPTERILFVAHHGLFAALTEVLVGARREGKNGVPYEFRRDGAVWTIAATV